MGETAYCRIEGAKSGSRQHNNREQIPDYVNRDLMNKNVHIYFNDKAERTDLKPKSHAEIREELANFYKENTGQKVQKNQNLIGEGLILFGEHNTDGEIASAIEGFCKEFGMAIIELHIHRDEGHFDEDKNWKPNLHAHFNFKNLQMQDNFVEKMNKKGEVTLTNLKGKSLKFSPKDTSRMQNYFASALNLKRGNSKSREHLEHIQYKNMIQESKATELSLKIASKFTLLEEANSKVRQGEEAARIAVEKEREAREKLETAEKILEGTEKISTFKALMNPKELQAAVALAQEKIIERDSRISTLEGKMSELSADVGKLHDERYKLRQEKELLEKKVAAIKPPESFGELLDKELKKTGGFESVSKKLLQIHNERKENVALSEKTAAFIEVNNLYTGNERDYKAVQKFLDKQSEGWIEPDRCFDIIEKANKILEQKKWVPDLSQGRNIDFTL